MLELLSPARTAEDVVAAVQSGADAIYILPGYGRPDGGFTGLTDAEIRTAVRYCRTRGCRAYISVEGYYSDDELTQAAELACRAYAMGAHGLIVSDIGLARALKKAVPDMPILGGAGLDIQNPDAARAAAEIGFSRVRLANELTSEEIAEIAASADIELEILLHGDQCVCRSGQCYISTLYNGKNMHKGECAKLCRAQTTMGGRMDDHPLSMKKVCLASHLAEIEELGIACVRIGEMELPTEYTAYLTELYSGLIREKRQMTPGEKQKLRDAFPPDTVTDGYFTGKRENMFLPPTETDKEKTKMLSDVKKRYSKDERRRVEITVYALIQKNRPSQFAADDSDGNRVIVEGPVPRNSAVQGLNTANVERELQRTAGTPYRCKEVKCAVEPGLWLEAEELAGARAELVNRLSDVRRAVPERTAGRLPPMPADMSRVTKPGLIFQVMRADQLTEELAELDPAMLYAPLELLAEDFSAAASFAGRGIPIAAVMPRVIRSGEMGRVCDMLRSVKAMGVNEVLINDLGHIRAVRESGMSVRGDYGLNAGNSFTMGVLDDAHFRSATVSFETGIGAIGRLSKPIDTEMIAYGRLPVMVTEHCLIKNSSLRCSCDNLNRLSDGRGASFPVSREFGCRNIIFNSRKLYLGDRQQELSELGLSYLRLMFTGESDRECVQVAKSFLGLSGYRPNSLTRGPYYRGDR